MVWIIPGIWPVGWWKGVSEASCTVEQLAEFAEGVFRVHMDLFTDWSAITDYGEYRPMYS